MNGIARDCRFDAWKGRELVAGGASRDLADSRLPRKRKRRILGDGWGMGPVGMAGRGLLLGRVKRAGRSVFLLLWFLLRHLQVAGMRASLAGRVTALAPVEVAGLSLGGIAGEREGERPDWERHRRKSYDDDRGKESYRPTDFQEITFWGEATP